MRPSEEVLKQRRPDLDEELLKQHLTRLEERYFDRFDLSEVCSHLDGISGLSRENPIQTMIRADSLGAIHCTILAFDYPFEFSLISGVLASTGYEIRSGNVFTYQSAPTPAASGRRRRKPRKRLTEKAGHQGILQRRKIIDHFIGSIQQPTLFSDWSDTVRERLGRVFVLLEAQETDALIEARRTVNEWVASSLSRRNIDSLSILYPIHMEVDETEERCTRIKVLSEDTPFFLYSFTTALSLRNVSIEHIRIHTMEHRIEDEFEFVDALQGRKLDSKTLNDVKLSLLMTKQFTYFLGRAPDPYNALIRFEKLIADILKLPEQNRLLDLLSNPRVMQDLARLLGTSDFLWEDFIRLQYENLLPLLGPRLEGKRFCPPLETLPKRLSETLEGADTMEEQKRRLNDFKDNELFLIDLDHILSKEFDFRKLSERLTVLAECIVNAAFTLSHRRLQNRYGHPKTVAGLDARFALLGLGKLGGQALGYASDIEFVFVYSDSGQTAGCRADEGVEVRISNAEYYEYLVKAAVGMIETKTEGIFHIDLRLRPYGKDGPLACSLESFCHYYGQEGPAHSYEKLALVRLRCFGGDESFGSMIERLRDRMIYSSQSIDVESLQALREKQIREKSVPGKLNAKFSPGALVDLEYTVQMLQVIHGEEFRELRTPSIHRALEGLVSVGVVRTEEAELVVMSYHFLRQLINGLRMLRGSARDLYLPPIDSDEFKHLARRIGYMDRPEMDPEMSLHLDFETATASVRVFIERHFGPDALPHTARRNVADLVLSDTPNRPEEGRILLRAGFTDTQRAATNLRNLAGRGDQRSKFAKLAVLACDILARGADPDTALNNWERFVRSLENPTSHFEALLAQPMQLEILLDIFSSSQFLSNTLINNPSFLDWVTNPTSLQTVRKTEEMARDLRSLSVEAASQEEWLDALRVFRRREILRIGTKDLCLDKPTTEIVRELSSLAEAVTSVVLEKIWIDRESELPLEAPLLADRFCVLAFGKLGGRELNYSSDIDLLGLYAEAPEDDSTTSELYGRVLERLRSDLSSHSQEGYVYRVDFRLRPYGRSGSLAYTRPSLISYYEKNADIWEIQALLKARPIAGNLDLGQEFLDSIRPILSRPLGRAEIARSIRKTRRKAVKHNTQWLVGDIDVKNGHGGIRDVEFTVQGLQLMNLSQFPELIEGNTLEALNALGVRQLLSQETVRQLSEDYLFLRKVEHSLQIWEDQQIHALPREAGELNRMARKLLGTGSTGNDLLARIEKCQRRVAEVCENHLYCLLEEDPRTPD
jgi:glutamate-ammonia-ligase adenylyltransferase